MSKDILIVAAKRTPIGSFQGDLRHFSASQLGSIVIEAALRDVKRVQPTDTTLEHNSEMEYEHIV